MCLFKLYYVQVVAEVGEEGLVEGGEGVEVGLEGGGEVEVGLEGGGEVEVGLEVVEVAGVVGGGGGEVGG